LIGFLFTGSTTFIALGKALQSFITSISRGILFLIPAVFIMSHFWQLDGVWFAFPVVDCLTTILTASLLLPQLTALRKKKTIENAAAVKT
jgi:Na+-driven multidrug efflux pump